MRSFEGSFTGAFIADCSARAPRVKLGNSRGSRFRQCRARPLRHVAECHVEADSAQNGLVSSTPARRNFQASRFVEIAFAAFPVRFVNDAAVRCIAASIRDSRLWHVAARLVRSGGEMRALSLPR